MMTPLHHTDTTPGDTTMTDFQAVAASVCIDCAMVAANDDDSGASASWSREAYAHGLDGGTLVLVSSPAPWFSALRCDACRSDLAGDRFEAEIWYNN